MVQLTSFSLLGDSVGHRTLIRLLEALRLEFTASSAEAIAVHGALE